MIKITSILLITLSLMSVTYSITPAELHKAFITCDNQTRIVSQCSTNPLNKTAYGKGADKCADDYYKSWICFNAFSSCTKSIADLKSTEDVISLLIKQIPVHCWNCFVDSPAQTEIYKQYQQCLINNYAYHTMGFFLAMMLVLVFVMA